MCAWWIREVLNVPGGATSTVMARTRLKRCVST